MDTVLHNFFGIFLVALICEISLMFGHYFQPFMSPVWFWCVSKSKYYYRLRLDSSDYFMKIEHIKIKEFISERKILEIVHFFAVVEKNGFHEIFIPLNIDNLYLNFRQLTIYIFLWVFYDANRFYEMFPSM